MAAEDVRRIRMTSAIENLKSAQQRAMAGRPKIGGFPYLAETLRHAGVIRNLWFFAGMPKSVPDR